jgi:hypothetical protein
MENLEKSPKNTMSKNIQLKRKKIKIKKYYIKDVGSEIYAIGLCRQRIDEESSHNESKSHRKLRRIVCIFLILCLVKYCSLLVYYQNQEEDIIDEKMFIRFGDFFFFQPQIRKHIIVALIAIGLRLLHTQFLYHRLWKSGRMRCIPSAQLFQVFAGMRSSKELGLGWKDVIKLMKM